MNVLVKKSAVRKYGALHTEGKSEAEVKAAIAGDEKNFSEAEVDEIYAAITDGAAGEESNPSGAGDGSAGADDQQGAGDDKDKEGSGAGGSGDASKQSQEPSKPEPVKYIVVKEFRDIHDFSLQHDVDSDVSHFAADRLEDLLEKGLIEKR